MSRAPTIADYLKVPPNPLRQAGGSRSVGQNANPGLPLVSVFTIVRNRKATLPGAIRSVSSQTYPNIEYIIVDGASTDGTLEVLRNFDDQIDRWISEPDRGTSDAINKAISLTRGDFVCQLASDDWFEADFVESAVKALLASGADFVFGDLRIYRDDVLLQIVKGNTEGGKLITPEPRSFHFPAAVTRTSPTMLTKKTWFQKLGMYDLKYNIRNDFEWILRLHLGGAVGFYDPAVVGHFRLGGHSDKGSDFVHIFENLRILRQHRLLTARVAAPYLYRLIRYSTGHLTRLVLPGVVHRTLKRVIRRNPL